MFAWADGLGFWSLNARPSFGHLSGMKIFNSASQTLLHCSRQPALSKTRDNKVQNSKSAPTRAFESPVVVDQTVRPSTSKNAEASRNPTKHPAQALLAGDEVLTSRCVPDAFCRDPQCGHGDAGARSLRSLSAWETMHKHLEQLRHTLCQRL